MSKQTKLFPDNNKKKNNEKKNDENRKNKFIQGNCYEILKNKKYNELFDVLFSDPIFKDTITGTDLSISLKGYLDYDEFFVLANRVLKKDAAAIILICNFLNAVDIYNFSKIYNWDFQAIRIRDKSPTRTWISWKHPLRMTEYVVYLKRGEFEYCFKDGTVKPRVNRSSFGGALRKAGKDTKKDRVSYGMYQDIFKAPAVKKKMRKHPTQKPPIYSIECAKIVGTDKYVLDPMCGSGALLECFPLSLGIDLIDYWNNNPGEYK
jgi:hypothetical protein